METYRLTYISSASIQSIEIQADSLVSAVDGNRSRELIKVERVF
jgi:hypothetical protein